MQSDADGGTGADADNVRLTCNVHTIGAKGGFL
jgi:hypothetical protein